MAGQVVPARSMVQRFEALERANEVRVYRARMKREMRVGAVTLAAVFEDEMWATARVLEVLMALPGCGRVRATTVLRRAGISLSKTVGGLSDRQRGALAVEMGRFPSMRGLVVA